MYVTTENNKEYMLRFWNGEPSKALIWKIMAPWSDDLHAIAHEQGYNSGDLIADNLDFFAAEVGCVSHGIFEVAKAENKNMQTVKYEKDGMHIYEYQTPHGVLTKKLMDGQVQEHKIKSQEDLKAYIAILHDTEIVPDSENYLRNHKLHSSKMPFIVHPNMASAAQQFLQLDTGVVNFWYFAMDCPLLLEECMEAYQILMQKRYSIMQEVESDGFFQAENTSTATISPEYYQKYGVPQVKEFVDAAHAADKRAIVHMCGHLFDLMPFIKETGMDGIHALTPEPIGNTSFEYAYSVMPSNTSILGRFGSQEWIGKSKTEILNNLANILPHSIYQEHPFMLIVTSDLENFNIDDLHNLRDAIAEYEEKG